VARSTTRPWIPRRTAATDKYRNFKVCQTCKVEKRLADFDLSGSNWRKKRAADPKRYKAHCKECIRAPSARAIDPNFDADTGALRTKPPPFTPEQRLERAAQRKRRTRRDARIKSLEYLAEKGCCDCGIKDPRVLEFDHIDPKEKKYNISALLSRGTPWSSEILRSEIRKCRVICANCHRIHTVGQQDYYGHPEVRSALNALLEEHDV
jgi:hypothetical protein